MSSVGRLVPFRDGSSLIIVDWPEDAAQMCDSGAVWIPITGRHSAPRGVSAAALYGVETLWPSCHFALGV